MKCSHILSLAMVALVSAVRAGTPQTIDFPAIGTKLTTDAPFAAGATATSGLTVSYSVVSPGSVASVASGTVTLSGATGPVTIKASQAGNGTFDPAPDAFATFQVVTPSQRYVKLTASGGPYSNHVLAIRADGTLWGWGASDNGALGDGTYEDRSAPVQIGTATNWSVIGAGNYHSLGVRANGSLWSWGYGNLGQTGDGTTGSTNVPTQVGTALN